MNKSLPTSDRTTRKDTPSVVAAVTVRSLPGEWRKVHCAVNKCSDSFYCCAFDLEAVLPVWTKISDDPNTWPKPEVVFMFSKDGTTGMRLFRKDYAIYRREGKYDGVFIDTYWRPLCDLDTP